jgi:hypothetical protein
MLHHSLEHMIRPRATLAKVRELAKPGGSILVRTPLADCSAREIYGADWVQLDAPRHLYVHTGKSVALLAGDVGLELRRTVYDSTGFQFWASEQYRRGLSLHMRPAATQPRCVYTPSELEAFEARAKELNRAGNGDQACFYFVRAQRQT